MNIRKQLMISNLMMIVIPVMAAALAGLCCVGLLWHVIHHGSGVGVDDTADFNGLARIAISHVRDGIEESSLGDPSSSLPDLIDANTMYLVVMKDGTEIYSYGLSEMKDSEMLEAVEGISDNEAIISAGGMNLYQAEFQMDDGFYEVFLFAAIQDMETRAFHMVAAFTWVVLICTIFLSVYLTNHFIIKSLFARIANPLRELSRGAKQLGEGNLDFRISYSRDDEFTPVCTLFNEMAEKLKELICRTQKDEESRKELIAGISHDLRSPLTSIQAYVEGLEDGVASTPEMRSRYLEVIKTKVRDIDALVSQLFLFSKLDMSDYPADIRVIDLGLFVRSFAERYRLEYEGRGLWIKCCVPDAEFRVKADETLLQRILSNIADNSVRYKKNEEGHLWIEMAENNGTVSLILSDDGPGVGDEEYACLFDVFYKGDKARSNPSLGSGLGLAISRKMAERMGGSIHAERSAYGGLAIVIDLEEEKDGCEEHSDNRR